MKLLHFTANWCVPCQKMKPVILNFINSNPQVEYVVIDIEEDFDTTKLYNVMSIPTLVAIVDDNVVGRHSGLADRSKIEELFKR